MTKQSFKSVWNAIEERPAEAENLKLRSELMSALKLQLGKRGWSQAETARRLGVTQPRVSDLLRGKLDLFSLDTLVNMAMTAGLQVRLDVSEAA